MQERKNEATYQEKYHRWRIKVQRNNETKYFYSAKQGRKGKLEAERKADEWLKLGDSTNMRVDTLCKLYLSNIDTGHSTSHLERETSTINTWILPFWEHRKVSSLTNMDYHDAIFRPVTAEPPRSKRTCGHVRSTIMALYKAARMAKIDMETPFALSLPKAATTKEKKVLSVNELQRLLTEGNNYWYINAFRLIAVLGLRRGELCGLQRSDLQGNVLMIRRSINSKREITTGKTPAAQRSIILPDIAQQILTAQTARIANISTLWLFPNINGQPINPNSLYNRWLELRSNLNLPPISIHELRHTTISILKNDVSLSHLKLLVGHTPAMTTLETYAHQISSDAENTTAEINAAYQKCGIKCGTD